jgi:hypothetical protein
VIRDDDDDDDNDDSLFLISSMHGKNANYLKGFIRTLEGKKMFVRPRCRCEDNRKRPVNIWSVNNKLRFCSTFRYFLTS